MKIPFTKAHGSRNDFLLTWAKDVPEGDRAQMAVAICDRHTGVGADGWLIVSPGDGDVDGAIELLNSDGSTAEMSGNGTRCAAAFLIDARLAGETVRIRTGAGVKTLCLLNRAGLEFEFEMDMGRAEVRDLHLSLPLHSGARDVTILWVGNPQCAVPVENFDFDWRGIGAEIERHAYFPNRTNVSFVKAVDEHTVDVRFWERGAGETMSSGTGSTGAAAAAMAWGIAQSPVSVNTPAGPLRLELKDTLHLRGPAVILAVGEYLL